MTRALRFVAALLASALAAGPVAAQPLPDATPLDLWGGLGIQAVARDGSLLYLGGSFSYIGPATGSLAVVDDATGAVVARAPDVSGSVHAVLGLPDGGWVMSGILRVGDGGSQQLLRLDAAGRVLPWYPEVSGTVLALATDGVRLYVAGTFAVIDGVSRRNIAAFDLATGALSAWDPGIGPPGGPGVVVDLEVSAGIVFAAGIFAEAGGQPADGFAAFSTTSATRLAHTVPVMDVQAMTAFGDTLFVMGADRGTGGTLGARVAMASAQTSSWPVPSAPTIVSRLHAASTAVYARTSLGLEALHPVTGASLGTLVFQSLSGELAVVGGTAYLVADLGPTHCELARADLATLSLASDRVACDGTARLDARGGRVAVAGIRSLGGVFRDGLAAIDLRTGRATAFAPPVVGTVRSLVTIGSVLVAGGDFTGVNGQVQDGLAALLPDGTLLPWRPLVRGPSNPVVNVGALATDGRRLFAGGTFSVVAGVAAPHLVAFDLPSGQLAGWRPAPNMPVFGLDLSGNVLGVAGAFTSIAGSARGYGAAFLADSLTLTPWDPAANLSISAIAVGAGVAVSGAFSTLQGQPAGGFGVFDASGRRLARSASFAFQRDLEMDGDRLFVAAGERVTASSLATGAPLGFVPTNLNSGVPGAFTRVRLLSDLLVATGVFDRVDGHARLGLAAFPAGATAPPAPLTAAVRGSTLSLGWAPPPGGVPDAYLVEAGRAPGATDLGAFTTTATSIAGDVPPGTYYVRVRGLTAQVRGSASAEAILTVPAPARPPGQPERLTGFVDQNGVFLSWGAAPGNAESYVLEAGTRSGAADIGAIGLGGITTRFFAVAPRGLYYLRVRARNQHGLGPAGNEVVLSVP